MTRITVLVVVSVFGCLLPPVQAGQSVEVIEADLLIVGGTESGCAAAVQAARMGVKKIVLVNDIEWLGGQFSAEALVAIDENTDRAGIRHDPPIPRHGAFREIIDRIEANNLKKYGVARPGNTRVITTTRPADAARVFRAWLQPYVDRGQLELRSWQEPARVIRAGNRVAGVEFQSVRLPTKTLRVNAALTVDASDWGDVVKLSGADYEFGPDLKSAYGEPLAPEKRTGYPQTDMNPITYCMVIKETEGDATIPRPVRYDPENYRHHRWPKDPLWLYGTRRIIDHYHFSQIQHPDMLLLCFPAIDYPLDVYPGPVARALEETEPGSARRNIVELSPAQRRIVFQDAKNYSLGFLHYLQTEVHAQMEDQTHSYRRFQLTDEFGTDDQLPFKPYIRESRRTKAMYMMRQQDTMGLNQDSANFASVMYHDSVAVWQFEYDFHPTKREFLRNGDPNGPWRCGFRDGRTWGPPYSGRSTLPVRSLIPVSTDGLLVAQKNLGYSSIVSSAVRLHDASMAVGQAVGAVAGYAILHRVAPRDIPFQRNHLINLQQSIAAVPEDGQPGVLWPWRDVNAAVPEFAAIQMLSVQRCLPVFGDRTRFEPDRPADQNWVAAVQESTRRQFRGDENLPAVEFGGLTRAQFAGRWWDAIRNLSWKPYSRKGDIDFDGDGVPDPDDALPVDPHNLKLPVSPPNPGTDGRPDSLTDDVVIVRQINFGDAVPSSLPGWDSDAGKQFDTQRGFGWNRDLTENQRRRTGAKTPDASFVFTRSHHLWEVSLPNGNYIVDVCVGDRSHEQAGQNVTIEGQPAIRNRDTSAGKFAEQQLPVRIADGRLSIEIGRPGGTSNTCLNWVRILQPSTKTETQ